MPDSMTDDLYRLQCRVELLEARLKDARDRTEVALEAVSKLEERRMTDTLIQQGGIALAVFVALWYFWPGGK